jgi:cytochrome b subunit of formate dehydrogenase
MNTHNPNVTPHPNTGPSSKRFFYGGIIVGFVLVVTGLVAFELLKLATYTTPVQSSIPESELFLALSDQRQRSSTKASR